ncbi:MAG: 50S ribosomal protein L29 [Acidobacteriaceae bacterium]
MTIKEMRLLSKNELMKQLAVFREQARDLRFKIHSKEVKNPHRLTNVRRDIARMLTLLKQMEGKK